MVVKWDEVSHISEEDYREHDFLVAYHGTSHRFRDSIEDKGLLTPRERPEEKVREDWQLDIDDDRYENLCYLSSESGAEFYASLSQKRFVGGKPMVLQIKASIDNLEPEPLNADTGAEISYQAILDGEVAHRGPIPSENILNYSVRGEYAIPPVNSREYNEVSESELHEAVLTENDQLFEKWDSEFDTQLD